MIVTMKVNIFVILIILQAFLYTEMPDLEKSD